MRSYANDGEGRDTAMLDAEMGLASEEEEEEEGGGGALPKVPSENGVVANTERVKPRLGTKKRELIGCKCSIF